jgi:hypothetical protein
LSKLSEYEKAKWIKSKLKNLLQKKYIVRDYNVIENKKPKKELYIFKK